MNLLNNLKIDEWNEFGYKPKPPLHLYCVESISHRLGRRIHLIDKNPDNKWNYSTVHKICGLIPVISLLTGAIDLLSAACAIADKRDKAFAARLLTRSALQFASNFFIAAWTLLLIADLAVTALQLARKPARQLPCPSTGENIPYDSFLKNIGGIDNLKAIEERVFTPDLEDVKSDLIKLAITPFEPGLDKGDAAEIQKTESALKRLEEEINKVYAMV